MQRAFLFFGWSVWGVVEWERMNIKNVIFSLVFISAVAVMPAAASAADDVATLEAQQAQLQQMQATLNELKESIASQYRKLVLEAVSGKADDEGLFPLTVNDLMVFPCEGQVLTDGEWCARSETPELGVSYVDLSHVGGFFYDGTGDYDLRLFRQRSLTYGVPDTPQYTFLLLEMK